MKAGYISVIIPLYNGEKYIESTIKRVQASKYQKLEIIVVDDGSRDQGVEICRKLQKKDQRIFIYSKTNGGIDSARNYGAERAGGEFLCFCDQDDIVENIMYEKLINAVVESHSDFGMCGTGRYIDGKKSEFEIFPTGIYEGEDILSELLYPVLFNGYNVPLKMCSDKRYPTIWKCVFRKSFWDKSGFKFRTYINYEDDLLLLIEALTKAEKVVTIQEKGYYWRINLKSETYAGKYVNHIYYKQRKCLEDILNSLQKREIEDKVINLYQMVAWCRFYVESIHNLTSPQVTKDKNNINKYFKENIYRGNFKKNIAARRWVKKGHIKPKILLFFLNKKMILTCYTMEKVLDWILLFVLQSPILIKLERKIKS